MNNTTRLQLIDSDVKGFLNIKGDTKVPLNFSVSDIRDISSRSGMFSKTITLTGDKNNNNILNNYFDVSIVAGTFDVNKRQKVAIVQNGIILRDNCFMRLLKVKKKQSVDSNIDEWVEYEVQVTDELGDFFKEVGNKEVRELDGWDEYKHIYGVDAVVDSFDHTVDDGYKYTLPWISNDQFIMSDLMPGVYAKQIFDKIHSMNGFSYDWATIADDDTQFDKAILPYAGDKKKLTEEYVDSVKVIADSPSVQETAKSILGNGVNNGYISSTPISTSNEIKDNSNWFNPTTGIYSNSLIVEAPNTLNYIVKINYDVVFVNDYSYGISLAQAFQRFTSNLRIVDTNGSVLKHTNRLPLEVNPANSSISQYGTSGSEIRISHLMGQSWNPGETIVASGNETFNIPITSLVGTEELRLEVNANMNNSAGSQWRRTGTFDAVDMKMKIVIKSIEIEIAPDSQNGLMPGTEIDIKNFLPTKMKQSDFLKTIYQKYNLYVEADPDNPSKLIYTSRDKFYDDGEVKDWTEKLDKKREQELYFIPDITTKKMILSYKDDDKDILLDAYRGETSKTFGQVDVTFDNENIKGEERKEEVFSPTISMETDFGAVLPVLNADFKMNTRILQDGGKLPCQQYSLKESDSKTVTSSFYPHLSMFDKPFNPTFSTEYAQSSFYAYSPGLFTENTLYNLHWRRTLAQINNGKMLKAWFWLTEEDIQGLSMNDKIKINNAYYYINAVIDYDANSNSVTKVELLTVEDDLKLPRVGGGIRNIGTIKEVVSGTIRPKVPSLPGGFFNEAIGRVIKERYDFSVVVSGPTPLTGNLGIGNVLPNGFRGVIVGDNLRPTEDGIYIDKVSVTNSGIFKEDSNGNRVGISLDDEGIQFTGEIDFSNAIVPELDDKEDKSNKVQDLNNPDAITYPSTDAVKNALDSKVESVTGTGVDNTDPINPIINIDKNTIGLGNVDNVQQIPLTDKGANNGVAELDSSGKIPISQLPSYVSDVETYPSLSSFPTTGADGIIYIAEDTNLTYRWTGSTYVEISPSIALGETSSTAYRGDRGKIAYDHSQLTSGNPHNVNKGDVGLGNVDNMKQINADALGSTTQDPNNPSHPVILTEHSNSPGQGTHWYIQTMEHSSSGSKTQIARQYGFTGNDDATYTRRYYNYNNTNHWTPWKRLVTDDDIPSSFVESVNGSNSGGITVDNTDPRNPIIRSNGRLPIPDTRNANEDPQWYLDNSLGFTTTEFKYISVMGLSSIFTSGQYCAVETITQFADYSSGGGYPFQIATNPADGKMAKRYGINGTTWSNWEEIDGDVDRLPLILGRESINDLPLYYQNTYPDSMVQEKKLVSTVGATSLIPSGSTLSVVTYIGTSSVNVYQVATSAASNRQIKRQGNITSNAWGSWEELIDISGKENSSNKVNNLNSPNTWEYPTTAAVQNAINNTSSSMTITPITYSALKTLKTNNSLEPGVRYYITDRDIWIDALDTDKLSMECKRHFRVVKDEYYTPHTTVGAITNNYLGIYGQTIARGSVPNSNSAIGGTTYYAIWGGRLWRRNDSGTDVPGTSDATIGGGWTMQAVTNNTYYDSKIFDIKYNFDDDIIWEQSDDRGNIIKRQNSTTSFIDITDWGNSNIYNNQCNGIYNNFGGSGKASIYDNFNNGIISRNSNNGVIFNNSNSGNISNNSNSGNINTNSNSGAINDNTNLGVINDNTNLGHILGNSNNGRINNNSNLGIIEGNSNGSHIDNNSNNGSIDFNTNISGTTDIRFNTNNGYIGGNIMNGSYLLEYNTNNGDIGTSSGTITRNADITDGKVDK